jgi:hypothetical protein
VRALLKEGVKVLFVTHMFDLARSFYLADRDDLLCLRAERGVTVHERSSCERVSHCPRASAVTPTSGSSARASDGEREPRVPSFPGGFSQRSE